MQTARIILSIVLSLPFIMLCSNDGTYTIKSVDGADIIHNRAPLWGNEPKITLELAQKFGDLESTDDNYILYNPYDVVRDTGGNVYVLDMGNNRIQKYDAEGNYSLTMGREGAGPGELSMAISINIDKKGDIVVADPGNNRIQKYSPDGKDLGSERTDIPFTPAYLRYLSTGERVQSGQMNADGKNTLIKIVDGDGNTIKEFGKNPYFNTDDMLAQQLGGNIFVDVDAHDNIIAAFVHLNRIDKYTQDGTLLFQTDRPLNYPVADKPKMRSVTLGTGQTVEMPVLTQISLTVQTDHKNRIWVVTFREQIDFENLNPGTPPEMNFDFHIFDENGIFLGTLQSGHTVQNIRVFDDRLYIIDTQKTMCVYEYKIIDL